MDTLREGLKRLRSKELDEEVSKEELLNQYKDVLQNYIEILEEQAEGYSDLFGGEISKDIVVRDGYAYFTLVFAGGTVYVDEDDFVYEGDGDWLYDGDVNTQAERVNEEFALDYILSEELNLEKAEDEHWYKIPETDLEICSEFDCEAEIDSEPEVTSYWEDPGDEYSPAVSEIEYSPESFETIIAITVRKKL